MSSTPRNLDDLVDEARKHLAPETHGADHDWRALDRALEERIRVTPRVANNGSRWAVASGVALAAAAAAVLLLRPAPPPIRASAPQEIAASVESPPAAGFRILSSRGELRGLSSPLHVGDRIETGAHPVSFVSHAPGDPTRQAVAWQVERESQLTVAHGQAPLGLTLENGAVEADVARVPQGEAFVVDVGPVRVAVKGTHLRVARSGNRATVDLTEGTIAIGAIPEAGLTTGKLVTAPAHVEIDLLRPTEIRIAAESEGVRARAFDRDVHAVAASRQVGRTTPTAAPTSPHASAHATAPTKPATTAAEARLPEEIVRDAVRACIDKHVPSGPVRVVINSTLTVDVEANGAVRLARFEPPLSPEVQQCASDAIYKTRFPGATTERISIAAER